MIEISPLEMNRIERRLHEAERLRAKYVPVDADVLRRLVAIAKNPPMGGYTVSFPISVTAPTILGETQITPAKLFNGTMNV